MYVLLILALSQPGTLAPPKAEAAVPKAQKTQLQPAAKAAVRELMRRCFTKARAEVETPEDMGNTAYFFTFDRKGRIADVDFLIEVDGPKTTFQTCVAEGVQPWPLVDPEANILRIGWPSVTTPNPNPPPMPRRPWHVVKPKHVCPATGLISEACITADGRRIRAPKDHLADGVALMLQRYHHIEGVTLDGDGAANLWPKLRKRRVKPNRVDVRETTEPLEVRIHAWRGQRLKIAR